MNIKLNKAISLLEQALGCTSQNNNKEHDVRMHIIRAISEAKYVTNKQIRKESKKDELTVLDQWTLDMEKNILMNPRERRIVVNTLDKLIDAERQKLEELQRKNKNDDQILPQSNNQNDMGPLFG